MPDINYRNPQYYRNRELSWLRFNDRVLSEARDRHLVPLFERMKFLAITASNLDEFFMIRVASLHSQVEAGIQKTDIAGMDAVEQLRRIGELTQEFVRKQYSTYSRSIKPSLRKAGIEILQDHSKLTKEECKYLDKYFQTHIYPVLTPLAVDSSRPFPLVPNRSLNIGALLRDKNPSKKKKKKKKYEFATVQVPQVLPRLIELKPKGDTVRFIFLEEVIRKYISILFQHYEVVCAYPYRIMRNADFTVEEDEDVDLLKEIEKQLKKRKRGEVIRLEVAEDMEPDLLAILQKNFRVGAQETYAIGGPIDLTFLMKLSGLPGYDQYRLVQHVPSPVPEFLGDESVFEVIKKKDVLVHHPYQSFEPVIRFIMEAAEDPNVLAIKQTLYRVSGDSPIIAALAKAAENGKQVTVLVELKARFDEEHNIVWARMLEKAGCNVIYGLRGLKTHSKITLIVRKEGDEICRYVHLGTGNYNDSTAKLYTDLGLFTCNTEIGEDATAAFNMISGYSEPEMWHHLIVAPYWMKERFLYLIARETEFASDGKKARIVAKMNSLCDPDIIEALYKASAAGVSIDLIVRGICCLKVGIPNVSEHITVRSIVGNYLEHSRIFYFYNGGAEEIFRGSADWMPRNLDRRMEIVFPVLSEPLRQEVLHILKMELKDNVKAHLLQIDGTYQKIDKRGKKLTDTQTIFCLEADKKLPKPKKKTAERRFEPMGPEEDDK